MVVEVGTEDTANLCTNEQVATLLLTALVIWLSLWH